jgi:hypothetical protein
MFGTNKQNGKQNLLPLHQRWLLLAAALAAIMPLNLQAEDYTFRAIAALGVAPNFGDLEVGANNNRGEVIFVSETADCVDTGLGFPGCEGVFLYHHGQLSQLVRPGGLAPGGGTFAGFICGPTAVNEPGDAAVAVLLSPGILPLWRNSGVFRYTAHSGTLSAVMLPGVTPAPGSGGLVIQGAAPGVSINSAGEIAFPGIISSSVTVPGSAFGGGVFKADRWGNVATVILPGQSVPGGAIDYAQNTTINARGDIAFEAHLAGAELIGNPDQSFQLNAEATGVYLSRAHSGDFLKLAAQGDLDPSGRLLRHAWGPVLNNAGQVLFVGDLTTAPAADQTQGLYLYSRGSVVPVVRPGDVLQGGGALQTVNGFYATYHLNNQGDVAFSGVLSTGEQGVYVRAAEHRGAGPGLVTKTGMVLPGIGTFKGVGGGFGGPVINDNGQLVFAADLTSGDTVLVVATPQESGQHSVNP